MTTATLFDDISVNVSTGAISYPEVDGFVLDSERVYRSAALFAPYCDTVQIAVRLAIHEQLSAFVGLRSMPLRGAS